MVDEPLGMGNSYCMPDKGEQLDPLFRGGDCYAMGFQVTANRALHTANSGPNHKNGQPKIANQGANFLPLQGGESALIQRQTTIHVL
jgi:hypothetical protein